MSRWRTRPVVVVLPLVPVIPISVHRRRRGRRTRRAPARWRPGGRRAPRSAAAAASAGSSTTTAAAPRATASATKRWPSDLAAAHRDEERARARGPAVAGQPGESRQRVGGMAQQAPRGARRDQLGRRLMASARRRRRRAPRSFPPELSPRPPGGCGPPRPLPSTRTRSPRWCSANTAERAGARRPRAPPRSGGALSSGSGGEPHRGNGSSGLVRPFPAGCGRLRRSGPPRTAIDGPAPGRERLAQHAGRHRGRDVSAVVRAPGLVDGDHRDQLGILGREHRRKGGAIRAGHVAAPIISRACRSSQARRRTCACPPVPESLAASARRLEHARRPPATRPGAPPRAHAGTVSPMAARISLISVGAISTPSLASAPYAAASWSGVTEKPYPIAMLCAS